MRGDGGREEWGRSRGGMKEGGPKIKVTAGMGSTGRLGMTALAAGSKDSANGEFVMRRRGGREGVTGTEQGHFV